MRHYESTSATTLNHVRVHSDTVAESGHHVHVPIHVPDSRSHQFR